VIALRKAVHIYSYLLYKVIPPPFVETTLPETHLDSFEARKRTTSEMSFGVPIGIICKAVVLRSSGAIDSMENI
jgi:hypothetical protein